MAVSNHSKPFDRDTGVAFGLESADAGDCLRILLLEKESGIFLASCP